MSERAVHVVVAGRVQGVGFRDWAVDRAPRPLRGWVRNRPDEGEVEVVAIGPAPDVDAFLAELRRGPRSAAVTGLATRPATEAEVATAGPGPFRRR